MSADEDECIHGLPPESCTICLHPHRGVEPDRVVYTMTAKYSGACPKCHDSIIEGDVIAHLMPSDTWVCSDCTP